MFDYAQKMGYIEKSDGYCGKCHLCVDIRTFLFNKFGAEKYLELAPAEFYETLIKESSL